MTERVAVILGVVVMVSGLWLAGFGWAWLTDHRLAPQTACSPVLARSGGVSL